MTSEHDDEAVPPWEEAFPGRLDAELDGLRTRSSFLSVDREALDAGQLSVHFDWPLDGETTVQLRAVYPDSYPYQRPHVFYTSGLDSPPTKHVNPLDGGLCLLGRDGRQWDAGLLLAELLDMNLGDALLGRGDEDPQGEPAEFWWNAIGSYGSFCLIDSAWSFGSADQGTMLIHYVASTDFATTGDEGRIRYPELQAFVADVKDCDGSLLHRWGGPLPSQLRDSNKATRIPWIRYEDPLLPEREVGQQVWAIFRQSRWLCKNLQPVRLGNNLSIQPFCVVHPSELGFGHLGAGCVFPVLFGPPKSFRQLNRSGKKKPLRAAIVPTYRAGSEDLSFRSPTSQVLKDAGVLIVGCGAVGAPVATELARNGIGTLHVLDQDVVEPGNSVRWPVGTSAWGLPKVEALKSFIDMEYPGTTVHPHHHAVGYARSPEQKGDREVLRGLFDNVDIVIDGSADPGLTAYLFHLCKHTNIPLISLFASPSVEGGIVARFMPAGACSNCLEHAWHSNEMTPPPGWGNEDLLDQPPGCSERTFIGPSYDLHELSLQAVRETVATLRHGPEADSRVYRLELKSDHGERLPPIWTATPLATHQDCGCREPDDLSFGSEICLVEKFG